MAQSDPRAVIFFLLFLFLLSNPFGPPPINNDREAFDRLISSERASLDVLRNSTRGDFAPNSGEDARWLNLTGLRQEDAYQWSLLPQVQEKARQGLGVVSYKPALEVLDGKSNGSLLLYKNVTGYLHGQWVQSKIQGDRSATVNLTAIVPEEDYPSLEWGRNITGPEGKISMRLTERLPRPEDGLPDRVRPIAARITIQDETSSGDGWAVVLHGVHDSRSGSITLTTTSEKFEGVFALPHLAFTDIGFSATYNLLNKSIERVIDGQVKDPRGSDWHPWSSLTNEDSPSQPLCDLVMYLQQKPLEEGLSDEDNDLTYAGFRELQSLEEDLRFPAGVYVSEPPKLTMSMIAFSPDCGFVLESKGPPDYDDDTPDTHLYGPKIEVYVRQTKSVMVFFMFVYAAQLLLLNKQMATSSTPSTRGRISYTSLGMLNMGSGIAAFGFLMLSSFVESVFLDSMILAFLSFLDGNYVGMRFLLDVWTAQEPERLEDLRARQRELDERAAVVAARVNAVLTSRESAPPPPPATRTTGAAAGTPAPLFDLPTPVTVAVPTTTTTTNTTTPTNPFTPPALRPPTFGALYARFSFTLLVLVFLSLSAMTSFPIPIRTVYANTLVLIYTSLWIPQIYRNIMRNTRKALLWRFVVGQSVLRLMPVAYFWCVRGNVMDTEVDRTMFAIIAAWISLQVLVLASQAILGPRWFVNERWSWIPEAWDWRPVLRDGDEEASLLPVGGSVVLADDNLGGNEEDENSDERDGAASAAAPLVAAASGATSKQRVYDCAICMQAIRVPVVSSSSRSRARSSTEGRESSGSASQRHRRGFAEASVFRRVLGAVFERVARLQRGDATGFAEDDYAITPCRHVFHAPCISSWLNVRSSCPVCRESLPSNSLS